MNEFEIAQKIGVSYSVFSRWKKRFPKILKAVSAGAEITDFWVESALLKRALGYEYRETKKKTSDKGEEETVTIKEMPPDLSAISIWLKNRRPDKWLKKPRDESGELIKKLDSIIEEIDDATV